MLLLRLSRAIATVACLATFAVQAQSYPSRPVELIVPYPPGGTTDFVARLIARHLSDRWGQSVVIANRPGASGALGAEIAAKAANDGHTLLVTGYTNRLLLFAPTRAPADPARDPVPVSLIGKAPLLLLANPGFEARSWRDLVRLAKAKPGALNYASIGPGSPSHLAMESAKRLAGIDLAHVPYKGSGPALLDVMSGHVPVMFDSAVSASPHVRSGKLRALAVTTANRLPSMPDVPTMAESGLPGFDVFTWIAVYAPAGTPQDRIDRVRREIDAILALPDVVERYAEQGALTPGPMSQADVAAFIEADIVHWRKLVKDADIRVDQ